MDEFTMASMSVWSGGPLCGEELRYSDFPWVCLGVVVCLGGCGDEFCAGEVMMGFIWC